MLKRIAILGAVLAALAYLGLEALRLSNSRSRQLVGELVTRVETVDSVVALTFDDGPIPVYTDSVLTVLSDLGVPATFFMVGKGMRDHPAIARRVLAAGHEIGNHSYTHRRLMLMSPGAIRREIEDTDALIRNSGFEGEIYVRPPYGKRLLGLPLFLQKHDRPVLLWSLEPDTYHQDANGVVDFVSERAHPGAIILLHVEIPSRVENRRALPRIVEELRAKGYRFVTLSDLMSRGSP